MELLLIIVVLVVLFLVWKRQAKGGAQSGGRRSARRTESAARNPFAAVSIVPCADACLAAWQLEGRRYLVREAPRLPLEECDSADCSCEFQPHTDRRTPGDRRSGLHTLDQEFAREGLPKRSRGRRKTDR